MYIAIVTAPATTAIPPTTPPRTAPTETPGGSVMAVASVVAVESDVAVLPLVPMVLVEEGGPVVTVGGSER